MSPKELKQRLELGDRFIKEICERDKVFMNKKRVTLPQKKENLVKTKELRAKKISKRICNLRSLISLGSG
jgi:hypothetical protein